MFRLLVCLCLAAVTARPFGKRAAFPAGLERHGKRESFGGRVRSAVGEVALDYAVEGHANLVAIDEDPNVLAAECRYDGGLVLTFERAPSKSDWEGEKVIAGGVEWGCRLHGAPAPILFKARDAIWTSDTVVRFRTVRATLTDAFATASIRMGDAAMASVERRRNAMPVPVTQMPERGLRPINKRACTTCSDLYPGYPACVTGSATIVSPGEGQSFQSGQTISVGWSGATGLSVGDCIVVDIVWGASCDISTTIVSGTFSIAPGMDVSGTVSLTVPAGVSATSSAFVCFTSEMWSQSTPYVSSNYFSINNIPPLVVTSPVDGDVVTAGNVTLITYAFDSTKLPGATQVYVALFIDVVGPDTFLTSWSGTASQGSGGLVYTLSSSAPSSNYYYWIVSWGTSTTYGYPYSSRSGYFSVVPSSPPTVELVITSPPRDSSFNVGVSVPITWVASQTVVAPVTVELRQESWGPSFFWSSQSYNNGYSPLPLTANILPPVSAVGTDFFFRLTYNCDLTGLFCSVAYSEYFSIGFSPKVTWAGPAGGVIFNTSLVASVTASWTSTVTGSVTYLSLMQSAPVDLQLGSSVSVGQSGGSNSFPLLGGSALPLFFVISYNCQILNYFCTNERGPIFHAPLQRSASLNYNSLTDSAQEVIPIWSTNCSDCVSNTTQLCQLCGSGAVMQASLACTNCYMTSGMQIGNLVLELGYFEVMHFSLNASGTAFVNVVVDLDASIEYQVNGNYTIFGKTMIPSLSYGLPSILGVSVSVGVSADLIGTYNFSLAVSGHATASMRTYIDFSCLSLYGTDVASPSTVITGGLRGYQSGLTTLTIAGNASLTLGLRPGLYLGVNPLAEVYVGFEPQLVTNVQSKFPPFTTTSPSLSWTPALITLGTSTCQSDHFVEFQNLLQGQFVGSITLGGGSLYSSGAQFYPFPFTPFSLLSGCFLQSLGNPVLLLVTTVTGFSVPLPRVVSEMGLDITGQTNSTVFVSTTVDANTTIVTFVLYFVTTPTATVQQTFALSCVAGSIFYQGIGTSRLNGKVNLTASNCNSLATTTIFTTSTSRATTAVSGTTSTSRVATTSAITSTIPATTSTTVVAATTAATGTGTTASVAVTTSQAASPTTATTLSGASGTTTAPGSTSTGTTAPGSTTASPSSTTGSTPVTTSSGFPSSTSDSGTPTATTVPALIVPQVSTAWKKARCSLVFASEFPDASDKIRVLVVKLLGVQDSQITVIPPTTTRTFSVDLAIAGDGTTTGGDLAASLMQSVAADPLVFRDADASSPRVVSLSAEEIPDSGLPLGAIIGIAVGGAVLLLGLVALIVILLLRRRKQQKKMAETASEIPLAAVTASPPPNSYYGAASEALSPRFSQKFGPGLEIEPAES